jgi:predicted nucleotidyltransferase/HEPN domain-containing protein
MKTELNYLPAHKQEELSQIITVIRESVPVEMIILFGSYARGDWVEEKYDDEHYRYQSDFDLLIVVENKNEVAQSKFEQDIETKLEQVETIVTPVSVIVHDIQFINGSLYKRKYFFSDIEKEGVLLYTSRKYQLEEARELQPEDRKKLAQEDFEYWFRNADEFFIDYTNAFERGSYAKAAFELHQVAERLYSGILLVFTRYKPNTHDLTILRKLANSIDSRLVKIFPFDTPENRRLFKLLRKAYVDARYKPSYNITQDELKHLSVQVKELEKIGKLLCSEKIESFNV